MVNSAKQAQRERKALIKQLLPIVAQQTAPFDAYKLGRLVNSAPMAVGQALSELEHLGALRALGEAPEGSLAERYMQVPHYRADVAVIATAHGKVLKFTRTDSPSPSFIPGGHLDPALARKFAAE